MKINSKDFCVRPGKKVALKEWPTIMKPFCKSKKRYRKLLEQHVAELSSLQCLHYELVTFSKSGSIGGKNSHDLMSEPWFLNETWVFLRASIKKVTRSTRPAAMHCC
jgi:hypothetical protein